MAIDFIDSKGLAARIDQLKKELAQLLHLQSFVARKPKRGRPAGTKMKSASAAKKKAGKRGKRGKLGADITKFLTGKGAAGAHVKDIASHVGSKPLNVSAWMYTTGKGKVKKVKPGTFALK